MSERSDVHQREEILDWLTKVEYGNKHSELQHRRQLGTGQWLLESDSYQKWLETSKQTLFCPGIPGAGKTMLTSIVIDDLIKKREADPSIGLAFLYCDFESRNEQKARDLLTSLLEQLTRGQSLLPTVVEDLYKHHKENRTRPSFNEILEVLQSVVSISSRVFIIIDALDECQDADRSRSQFLNEIFSLQTKCGANIFATSRFIPEITDRFKQSISVEIRASDEDIQKYLEGHMDELRSFVQHDQQLQAEIKTKISDSVGGMYVVQLVFGRRTTADFPQVSSRTDLFRLAERQVYSICYKKSAGEVPKTKSRIK
jgi:Cdc6-like AAA superfamily ATPase